MFYRVKIIYYFFFLILIPLNLNLKAEVLDKIIINGNKRVSDETIILYGKIKIKEDINEQKVNEIISNLNSTNFFEDINVELKNKTLILNLKEYPILNQILIVGEPSKKLSEEIKKNLKLKEKSSFIKSYLLTDVDIIKNLYSSAGYSFVTVKTKVNKVDVVN